MTLLTTLPGDVAEPHRYHPPRPSLVDEARRSLQCENPNFKDLLAPRYEEVLARVREDRFVQLEEGRVFLFAQRSDAV